MDNNVNGKTDTGATLDEQIRKKEDAQFMGDLEALQKKYKRVLLPIINHTKFGIFPGLKVYTLDEYQRIMGLVTGVNPMAAQPVDKAQG